MDADVFLRRDVIVEPLVDRFYAWLYNVAPCQAAMGLRFLLVPLLESYLQSPEVHIAASSNPDLRGGYFVNIPKERVPEVRALLDTIRSERKALLELGEAIDRGFELLHERANGFDLTSLYGLLPGALSGLVELAYDTSNQPSLRFLERLAYQEPALSRDRQSVQLSLETGAERPFILSTPRLPSPTALDLDLPFDHTGLRDLFLAKVKPTTLADLRDALEISSDADARQLSGFLTSTPPTVGSRDVEAGGRIRYFGHACLVLQTPDVAIVADPFICADPAGGSRFTYADLPDHIDLVLITHGHQDHIVLETLLALRGRVDRVVVPQSSRGNLADPSLELYLRHLGFEVLAVNDLDEIRFPGGRIVACPFLGEHADLDIRAKTTYWVAMAGRGIYVGADSSGVDAGLYRRFRRDIGPVDVAFLGMECDGAPLTWLYQSLLTKPVAKKMSDSRKLSGSDAAQACAIVSELGAGEAYVYAMGEEKWLGHVMATSYKEDSYQLLQVSQFEAWCAERGVKSEHLLERREWSWAT